MTQTATYGGEAYGFWKAQQYVCQIAARRVGDYVRIEFLGEAQLSRVEIDHDHAK